MENRIVLSSYASEGFLKFLSNPVVLYNRSFVAPTPSIVPTVLGLKPLKIKDKSLQPLYIITSHN